MHFWNMVTYSDSPYLSNLIALESDYCKTTAGNYEL